MRLIDLSTSSWTKSLSFVVYLRETVYKVCTRGKIQGRGHSVHMVIKAVFTNATLDGSKKELN